MKLGTTALGAACAVIASAQAGAVINATNLGTVSPVGNPATAGMTAFPLDPQPLSFVNSVASPLGGSVVFSMALDHNTIGAGWATWSHGYTGDNYFTGAGQTAVTLNMPGNTGSFYLYVEGNNFTPPANFVLTATNAGGDVVNLNLNGVSGQSGATGAVFTSSSALTSIMVSNPGGGANGFAVGEFGIALLPSPGALAAIALGGLIRRRRRN